MVLERGAGKEVTRGCVCICIYIKKFKQSPWTGNEEYSVFKFMQLQVHQQDFFFFLYKAGQFHLNVDKNLSMIHLSSLLQKIYVFNHSSFSVQ